jgi:hypothetical protein
MVSTISIMLAELLQNLSHLADVIETSMTLIMNTGSFKDPGSSAQDPQIGAQALASTAGILYE